MDNFEDKVMLYLLVFVLMANTCESISSSVVEKCGAGQVCVRFCCKNETLCLNFDLSSIEQAKNMSDDYKVIQGKPCDNMYLETDEIWSFTAVSEFFTVRIILQRTHQKRDKLSTLKFDF